MDYISYSQYNSYTRCPRSWYLSKVRKAEEKQTWYIPIGSAVHTAVESYLRGEPYDLEDIFYGLVSEQMAIEPDTTKWLAGGSQDDPVIEAKALQRANECHYNALEFLEDIDVYEIEYNATGRLPGLDVEIKAYIDVIGEHKKHGPTIVDWKTGRQKPKDNFQLETYKALISVPLPNGNDHPFTEHGSIQFNTGLWGMLSPEASKARPVDLSQVSPKDIGEKYQAVYDKMQRKLYQTNAGYNCRFCFNQENCLLEAGPTARAKYYDRADEDGYPY